MPNLPAVDLGRVLPPKGRQITYAVFVVLLVVAFAFDLAIDRNPEWLVAALRTLDGLAPLVLVLAAINVPTGEIVAGDNATAVYGSSNADREARNKEWAASRTDESFIDISGGTGHP